MDQTTDLDNAVSLEWIRAIPKAELHIHLLGAIRPRTALELARRHKVDLPFDSLEFWTPFFCTGNLAQFVERFILLFPLLREKEDFERVGREVFEDLHADGIRSVEPRITLTSHLLRGVSEEAIGEGLAAAACYAHETLGMKVRWIVDFPRILGLQVGRLALEAAIRGIAWGVAGFDIAGYEGPGEDDPAYCAIFARAREAGLHLTAHAGETGPPEHIRIAINEWGVERIGHGIQASRDSDLAEELASRKIPLEICPTSNIALGAVPDIYSHPLETFRQQSLRITINSDDPSLFGTTLSREYLIAAAAFGWDRETVLKIIEEGWLAAFPPHDLYKQSEC